MGILRTICCGPLGLYVTTAMVFTSVHIIGARHDLRVWRAMKRAAEEQAEKAAKAAANTKKISTSTTKALPSSITNTKKK